MAEYSPQGAAGFRAAIRKELLPSPKELKAAAEQLAGIEERLIPYAGQPYLHLISVPREVMVDSGMVEFGVFSNKELVPPSYATVYEGRILSGTVQGIDYSYEHDNLRLEAIMKASDSEKLVGSSDIRHDWHDSLAFGAYAGPRPDTHEHFLARQDGQLFRRYTLHLLDLNLEGESVGLAMWNGKIPEHIWHEHDMDYKGYPLGFTYSGVNSQVVLVGDEAVNWFFGFDKGRTGNTTESLYRTLVERAGLDPEEMVKLWKEGVWLHDLPSWGYEKEDSHKKEKLEGLQKALSVMTDDFFRRRLLTIEGTEEVLEGLRERQRKK